MRFLLLLAATLTWNPPTQNTDGSPLTNLAGYRILWGTATGGPYPSQKYIGAPATTDTVEVLNQGKVYFVIRSVRADNVESANSAQVMKDFGILDADGDGIADGTDNCRSHKNPSQCNSNADAYGNQCDGDLNNNNSTNAQDYLMFRLRLGLKTQGSVYDMADLNCNGVVNAQDYAIFRGLLGKAPGPGPQP